MRGVVRSKYNFKFKRKKKEAEVRKKEKRAGEQRKENGNTLFFKAKCFVKVKAEIMSARCDRGDIRFCSGVKSITALESLLLFLQLLPLVLDQLCVLLKATQ